VCDEGTGDRCAGDDRPVMSRIQTLGDMIEEREDSVMVMWKVCGAGPER
jgi:hypothetical protein